MGATESNLINRRGFAGVVATASAETEFAFALGLDEVNFHGAESAVGGGIGGIVAQGVLIANIAGDLHTDRVDVFEARGEESQPAGGFSEFGEIFGGFANHFFIVLAIVVAEDADGINHGVGINRGLEGIGETFAAGIVSSVGDD